MKKQKLLNVKKIDNQIELKNNSFVDKIELLFNIGGVVIPPLAIVGIGLSLINGCVQDKC